MSTPSQGQPAMGAQVQNQALGPMLEAAPARYGSQIEPIPHYFGLDGALDEALSKRLNDQSMIKRN